MAYRTGSRKVASEVSGRTPPSNLEDVLNIVLKSERLAARQRQDVASALRTFARLLHRPLADHPCDVRSVRLRLEGIAPARHGISKGRWSNIRSLIYRALDLAGVPRLPGRSSEPPSPAWERLLLPLPYRPFRVQLLPFARHCTRHGTEPQQVHQLTFEQFARELEELSGRTRPRSAYLDACRAWNKCGDGFAHWPAFRVHVQHRRDHYARDWSTFPASLKADIDAMVTAAVSSNPISPVKAIKQVSADNRVRMLRGFASALVCQGRDPNTISCIADLVQLDAVQQGLTFIYERARKKKTVHLHQHAKLLCTLARRWVGVPEEHLAQLQAIRNRLRVDCYGMTQKNRATLRCFEDERLVSGFLSLPQEVARRYGQKSKLKVTDAVQLQIALAIELLTFAPVRGKNLVSIRLDQNLIDQGSRHNRRVHLYFPVDAVKNDVALEFVLKPSTVSLLDHYVRRARPLLLRRPSEYLFPGEAYSHKGGSLLSEQIADMVENEVGVRLTGHQFRHLAGYLYLKANPGGHEVVRRLLGHKSIDTTLRFYAGMEVAEAVRHYDNHIAKRRAEMASRPRRRRMGSKKQ